MKKIFSSLIVICIGCSAFSQNMLIVDYNNAFSSDQNRWNSTIYNYLVGSRPSVTRVAAMPATISNVTYTQLWLYGNPGAISPANMNPLLNFIRGGGAVYIQSEVSCCNVQAAYLKAVMDSMVATAVIGHSVMLGGQFLYNHGQPCCPTFTESGAAIRHFVGVPAINQLFTVSNNCGGAIGVGTVAGVAFASCDLRGGQGALCATGDFNMFVNAPTCTGATGLWATSPLNTQPVNVLADLMINLVNCQYGCQTTIGGPVNLGPDTSICQGDSILLSSGTGGVPHQWSTGDTTTFIYANQPGTYYVVVGSNPACQVTDTINVVIGPAYSVTSNSGICQGDSLFAKGAWQKTTGLYVDTVSLPGGCDSIYGINLTVSPVYNSTLSPVICQGDSVLAGGIYRTTTGTFLDNLTTGAGCDSNITTILTVNPNQALNVNQTICNGDSLFLQGGYQTASGLYLDSHQTSTGCDSVVTTSLVVNATSTSNTNLNICQGTNYNFNGTTLTQTGTYVHTLQNGNSMGCDSVATLNLIVDPVYSNTVTNILCEGDSFYVGTGYVQTGGTFIANLSTSQGCDSSTTYVITYYPRVPFVLRPDTTLCLETELSIGLSPDINHTYSWNDGLTAATRTIDEAGVYTLTSNHKYCAFLESDMVEIDYKDCSYHLYIPNTFTPTGEGLNDRFGPKTFGDFDPDLYYFAIFDKWGELLFETDVMGVNWDGKLKGGNPAKTDTYVWKLKYKPVYGDEQSETGRVTLLK